MGAKPLFILDGARVTIEGYEVLIVLVPTQWETEEQKQNFQDRFSSMGRFEFPVALAQRQVDGKIVAVGTGTSREKLQARIDSGIQWTKIPFFASD